MLLVKQPHPMPLFIHLFHIPSLLLETPLHIARAALSPEESTSASNIKAERRLHEFIYGRYYLKHALAKHLNTPIENIIFKKHSHGKLYLEGNPTAFNLTHSGEYLAYAISDEGDIGVDIEHPQRKMSDLASIAERYFTQEESQALKRLSGAAQTQLFYKIWTLKEAALKTVGTGISAGLDRINAEAMDLSQPQTLALEHSRHALWFEYWYQPLGFNNVFLSIALEPKFTGAPKPDFRLVHTKQ